MPLKNRYFLCIWTGLALCFPTRPFPRPHSIGNPLIPLSCESITVATCSEEEDSNDPKWTSLSGLCLFLHQWKHPFYFGNHISCEHANIVLSQLTWKSCLLWTWEDGSLSADQGLRIHVQAWFGWLPREIPPFSKTGSGSKRERVEHTPLEFIHIWLLASHPCLPSTHSPESSDNVRSLWSK